MVTKMCFVFQVGSQHDMIVNVWDWKNNIKVGHQKHCFVSDIEFCD